MTLYASGNCVVYSQAMKKIYWEGRSGFAASNLPENVSSIALLCGKRS